MDWRRALLIGLPGAAVLVWGTYAVLFGFGVATASGPAKHCNATTDPDKKCEFVVRIEESGLVGCTANSDYTKIEVGTTFAIGERYSPKLIWRIEHSDPNGKYQFRDDGIKIKDSFSRADDLDEEGHEDASRKKFRWVSRNKRAGDFHFDPHVQRKALGWWWNCEPKDPLIANAGN